jgi:hypothetical protein
MTTAAASQIKSKTSTKTKQNYKWWLSETPVRTDFQSILIAGMHIMTNGLMNLRSFMYQTLIIHNDALIRHMFIYIAVS